MSDNPTKNGAAERVKKERKMFTKDVVDTLARRLEIAMANKPDDWTMFDALRYELELGLTEIERKGR